MKLSNQVDAAPTDKKSMVTIILFSLAIAVTFPLIALKGIIAADSGRRPLDPFTA